MTEAPVAPGDLRNIDWVLCTHAHTDHMDPGTLPGLLAANPGARVLVPRSASETAQARGVPKDRLRTIDAGETVDLGGVQVIATPAAHEDLARDEDGAYRFLGFILKGKDTALWHSGDTIPFPGLVEAVAPHRIDLALLPVNGRDENRASNGVPGNLTLDEALELSEAIGTRALIGHHLDLFDFNTLDRAEGQAVLEATQPGFPVELAEVNTLYRIDPVALPPLRILAICRGNICRSPLVEALLKDRLAGTGIQIDSAAIEDWNIGKAPDPRSIEVASRHGLDISEQRARQLREKDFHEFDLILAMDRANLVGLESRRPESASARVMVLGNLSDHSALAEIEDPYYGPDEGFDTCFRQIERNVDLLAEKVIR